MTDEVEVEVDLADHRPDIYEEGGGWVFRASSFGGCESNLVRQAVGMTPDNPPDFLARGYAEGAKYEEEVLKAFAKRYGFRFMMPKALAQRYGDSAVQANGQIELDVKVPGGVVRVHPDGVAKCFKIEGTDRAKYDTMPYTLGEMFVVEAKVLVEGSQPMANVNYEWQTSIEMAATGLPLAFVVAWKDKETRELLRNEDGGIKLTVAWFRDPLHKLGAIKVRAARLGKLIRAFDDGGGVPPCDRKQFPCGFFKDHDKGEGSIWFEEEAPEVPGVKELLVEWETLDEEIRERQSRVADIRADVLGVVHELGLDPGKMVCEGMKFKRVFRGPSKKFDRRAAEAAGYKDLLDQFVTFGSASDYVQRDW